MKNISFSALPDEIIIEILIRLPIKSLLRAKTVCRLWYNLISGKYLSELHRRFASKSKSPIVLLQFRSGRRMAQKRLIAIDCSKSVSEFSANYLNDFMVRASCNGLLCLSSSQRVYHVCNPITREVKKLPELEVTTSMIMFLFKVLVGLTFDLTTLRYKVVLGGLLKVTDKPVYTKMFVCLVFDSYNKKWRKFESMQVYQRRSIIRQRVVFINGCPHWLVIGRELCVLSLDLESEIWRRILLPTEIGPDDRLTLHLMEFDGSLSLILVCEVRIRIWVMTDNRHKQWCMVDEINIQQLDENNESVFPVSLTGEHLIVQTNAQICLYDRQQRVWKHLYGRQRPNFWYLPHIYRGVFFSLK